MTIAIGIACMSLGACIGYAACALMFAARESDDEER